MNFAQQNVGPDLDLNCDTDGIPESFTTKKFNKICRLQKGHAKLPGLQRVCVSLHPQNQKVLSEGVQIW